MPTQAVEVLNVPDYLVESEEGWDLTGDIYSKDISECHSNSEIDVRMAVL